MHLIGEVVVKRPDRGDLPGPGRGVQAVARIPAVLVLDPVQKLIVRYAIPTALTLMVNCLYNIVDQIFVGQGVGITAMAAINVAFPVVILVNAVALLLGDGSAANISLCLGRRQQQEADDTIGHAATLIAASGLCAAIVSWCFAPQIARLFGATDTAWPEAAAYLRTIAWGLPFQLICPAFTAIIRADGHPRYSMGCMITGAVLNLILDPVFIFPLGMGVVGAGIATVIGQVAAGVLFLAYLPRLHTVRLRRQALRPTIRLTGRILALGVPSLLTQILTALVQITLNNLLRVHGAASVYGSDIALSVYGMMMKVYQIAHSMFVGVSSAVQPINGYNFGAKHFLRVRQTFRTAAAIALVISGVWFLVFQLFPRQILSIFGSEDPLFYEFSIHYIRIYLLMTFVNAFQPIPSNFFTSIGKAKLGFWMALVRQGLLLIPLLLLLPLALGMDGVLWAGPISDGVAAVLVLVLGAREVRRLTVQQEETP